MAAGREKRQDIQTDFFKLFLEIGNCQYRNQCKNDFEQLDISVRPQGGFIGKNYEKSRVLIIGQNPGGGKAARGNLGAEDDYYYNQVEEMVKSESRSMFSDFMNYLENDFMPRWPIFRNLDLNAHWEINISDIALINAVHCRTIDDATPNDSISMRCFSEYTLKQINLLEPKAIICFGKKAYDFLGKLYHDVTTPIKYILHPSGAYTRQHPEKQVMLVNDVARLLTYKKKPSNEKAGLKAPTKYQTRRKSELETKKEKSPKKSRDRTWVQEELKRYLISIGFREVSKSFFWSGEHPSVGKINFHNDGKTFGSSLLSNNVRNNCGYSASQRRLMSYDEREKVYRQYLENKPYYKDIEHSIKFYFKKTATDYVGLDFDIGFENIKKVIDSELR